MAKKSRSARKRTGPDSSASPKVYARSSASVDVSPSDISEVVAQSQVEFTSDYYYVYNDLRTMSIISLLMLGVMVGLSFVI